MRIRLRMKVESLEFRVYSYYRMPIGCVCQYVYPLYVYGPQYRFKKYSVARHWLKRPRGSEFNIIAILILYNIIVICWGLNNSTSLLILFLYNPWAIEF